MSDFENTDDERIVKQDDNVSQLKEKEEQTVVPPWRRYVLTITEAANYYHIGETKLRSLVQDNPNSEFAVLNGNRVLIKRKQFERFLDMATAI